MLNNVSREAMIDLARRACGTLMRKFAAPDLPPKGRFHYHQGVFLAGMEKLYQLTGDEAYSDYIKAWVDSLISPYGNIYECNPGQLDDLQPGVLLFRLYDQTGDKRYKRAMDTIAYYISHFPKNPEGGYWHKAWYRDQMWLDGLYMAGPFSVLYGTRFERPDLVEEAIFQARMMREKTEDKRTGLWYHAFDYNKEQPWADADTGRSPEFWGRAMGWVPVALLEEWEGLPEGHPGREALRHIIVDLLKALLPWQDERTGLWYQVTNKGKEADNWLESSCSCLYSAAICKAVRLGLMDSEHLAAAKKAVAGIAHTLREDDKGLLIENICVGTGVGDYAHYIARPRSTNDLHGVGAFLLMCAEAAQVF